MPIVSAGDLTLLRGQGHRSSVYTSFLIPPTLWQARIDDVSIVQGETTIAFDQGTGSFFTLVEALQDLWVGTAAGRDDVGGVGNGRLRIRSISSGDGGVTGTVTVGGNSLPFQDNQYLTFKHDYPLRPRWSFVDPSTEIWYIDDDITYTDQHEEPPPVVIAGPHRAGFLVSGSFAINVDSSDSYTIAQGATKSSYALSVASTAGTPTVNFNTGTGLGDITFADPGYYWAKYSVTDSNGKTQVSYRCYIVHDGDPSGFYPYVDADTIVLTGDWNTGGWIAGIESQDKHSLAEIPNHALCIIWRDSWYGDTEKAITFLDDSASTIFAGYVRGEVEEKDMANGMENVDLVASTVEGRLARIYSFSASLVAQQSGVNHWGEIPNWHTVGTLVHALLRWRSTIFEIADVIGLRDNTWRRAGYEPDDNNLYDMANNFSMNEGIRAKLVSDQGGRLHFAHDMQLMIASERAALNTTFALQKDVNAADYGGSLIIPRAPEPEAPFVTSDGIYWDGTTWDDDDRPKATGDWCVIAPGGKPLHEGPSPKDFPRQTVPSLAYLRELAGRYLGKTNNPIEEIRLDFAGDYLGVLDVAYDDAAYEISLATGDTPRGQVLTNHLLFCRNIAARWRSGEGIWLCEASFEPYAEGITGVETQCPSFPALGGTIPIIPLPAQLPGALMTGASVHYKSATGDAWTQRVATDVKDLDQDPYWRIKTSSTDPSNAIVFRCGVGSIRRSTDAFISTDVDVTPGTNPPNNAGDSPAPTVGAVTFRQVEGSFPTQDTFVFLATWQNTSDVWRSWLLLTDDNGSTWSWESVATGAGGPISSWDAGVDVSDDPPTDKIFMHKGGQWSTYETSDRVGPDTYIYQWSDKLNAVRYMRAFNTDGTYGDRVGYVAPSTSSEFTICSLNPASYTFLIGYMKNTGTYLDYFLRVCEVGGLDGVTITLGTEYHLSGYQGNPSVHLWSFHVERLTNTTALVTLVKNIGIGVDNYAMVVTTSDLTIDSVGSAVDFSSGATDSAFQVFSMALSSSRAIIVWVRNYFDGQIRKQIRAVEASISGETITLGASDYELAADNGEEPGHVYGKATSSTKFILTFIRTVTDVVKTIVGEVDISDVITKGSEVTIHSDNQTDNYPPTISVVDSSTVVIAYEVAADPGFYARFVTIAGLVPTLGSTSYFNETGSPRLPHVHYDNSKLVVIYELDDVIGGSWDYARFTIGNLTFSGLDLKALGMSVGKGVGDRVWITGHAGSALELFLIEYTLPGLGFSQALSMGAATVPELDNKSYICYPFVPFGFDDAVYVYGRMNNPQGVGGNPVHIIRTTDGGSSFNLVEDSWGVDHCGSLVIGMDAKTYAIRNRAGQAKLYRDNGDSILLLRLTFPWAGQVAPKGMFVARTTLDVYVAAWVSDSFMVSHVPPPHLLEKDITFDHATTDPIEVIIQL